MLAGICTRGLRSGSAGWSARASVFTSAGWPNPLTGSSSAQEKAVPGVREISGSSTLDGAGSKPARSQWVS